MPNNNDYDPYTAFKKKREAPLSQQPGAKKPAEYDPYAAFKKQGAPAEAGAEAAPAEHDPYRAFKTLPPTTQAGAAVRGVGRSVAPLAAGVAAGRVVGGIAGTLGAGPVGGFIAGTLGGLAGGYIADWAQRALGLVGGPQEQADISQYPKTSMVAGAVPQLALGRPSAALDLGRRAAGAATMGAIETGAELAHGGVQGLDPGRIAFQAGVGGALNEPWRYGQAVPGEAAPSAIPGAPERPEVAPGEKPADISAELPERATTGVPKPGMPMGARQAELGLEAPPQQPRLPGLPTPGVVPPGTRGAPVGDPLARRYLEHFPPLEPTQRELGLPGGTYAGAQRELPGVGFPGEKAEALRRAKEAAATEAQTRETTQRLTSKGGEPEASAQFAGRFVEDQAAGRAALPEGRAVGAEHVTVLPVNRNTVIGYDRDMRLMDQQRHAAAIKAHQELQNPRGQAGNPLPNLMNYAKQLYRMGERNPNVAYPEGMSVEEARRLDDEWMLPEREKLHTEHVANRRTLANNPRFGEDIAAVHDADYQPDSSYMPHINLKYAMTQFRGLARSLLGGEEWTGGPRAGGFGLGRFIAPSQQGRKFFTLQSGDERKLMHFDRGSLHEVGGTSRYSVVKELRKQAFKSQYGSVAEGLRYARIAREELRKGGARAALAARRPVPGMKFTDPSTIVGGRRVPGREWTLTHARAEEINTKTEADDHIVENGPIAIKLAQLNEERMGREMRYLDGLQARMMAQGQLSTKKIKDFVQTSAMGFKNLWVDPRIAHSLDRFGPHDPSTGVPISEYLAKLNQFVTRSFMAYPIPHLRNIGIQWLINENIGLADRRRMGSLMESWHDAINQSDFFLHAVNEGGARLWGAPEHAGKFWQYAEKEIAATEGMRPVYSIWERLGNHRFNPWNISHHAIAVAQDTLMLDMIKARMKPVAEGGKGMSIREAADEVNDVFGYDVPTELPFGQDVVPGRAGQVLASLSRIPAKISEDKIGRSAFNFVRWNYLRARLAYAPFFGAGKGAYQAIYQRNPKLLAENGAKIATMLIAQQLVMPLGDNLVQKMTGDQRSRMTRWGSLAIIQAFDDILHGRGTPYESLSLMLINLSPLFSAIVHTGEYLAGSKSYGKRMSLVDLGKKLITTDYPLGGMLERPTREPQPWGAAGAEAIFGTGKQPRTYEEERQQEQMRRMMPKIPKPAQPPSRFPWLY